MTACLGLSLAITASVPAFAQTKEEVQSNIDSLQGQQTQLESRLSGLQQNKTNTESALAELNSKLKTYTAKLEKVASELTDTEAKITLTNENLKKAKEDEKTQYSALKARIKTMYEAGDEDFIEMILSSDDLKSLLNNSEYASKINEYDQSLLANLQATEKKIAKYEKKLKEQKKLQQTQQKKFESAKKDVESLVGQKQTELASISSDIQLVSTDLSSTAEELKAENGVLEEIAAQERQEALRRAQEEEAAQKETQTQTDTSYASADTGSSQSTTSYTAPETRQTYARSSGSSQSSSSAASTASASTSSSSSYSGSSSGSFRWPVGSTNITSYYGSRSAPTAGATSNHQGLDISASAGSSIYAAAGGTVTKTAYNSAMGNYVVVDHGNNVSTIYEHCSSINVSAGQKISGGQSIASVGSTGVATGAHLHFGVTVGGSYVNPLSYVSPN